MFSEGTESWSLLLLMAHSHSPFVRSFVRSFIRSSLGRCVIRLVLLQRAAGVVSRLQTHCDSHTDGLITSGIIRGNPLCDPAIPS